MLNKAQKEKEFKYVYVWSEKHKQYILIEREVKPKKEKKDEK